MSTSKVYIGNLGDNGDRDRIWKAFESFGKIREVWVARNPPGFAFVEFHDPYDAEDAVDKMDGKRVCDKTVRVELSKRPGRRDRGGGGGGGGGRRGGYRNDRRYDDRRYSDRGYDDRGGRYSPPPQRRRSRSPPPRGGGRDREPMRGDYRRRSRSLSPPPRQ